ncbi:uncharacterized protein [Antedon mediterranea]|uniref:uncharacterized protein n=1 Tax=Antedon mediterranea TaxID=105859 RepID=UPI003AF92407
MPPPAMQPKAKHLTNRYFISYFYSQYSVLNKKMNRFEPYTNEPMPAHNEEDDVEVQQVVQEQQNRLINMDWCKCQRCSHMASFDECLCCTEIIAIRETLERDQEVTGPVTCITEHPGFDPVCLNVWTLQLSIGRGRRHRNKSINEKYRHASYKNFVRWTHGYLGRGNRTILPACVVKTIRNHFQSETYVGFKYPNI